MEYGASSFKYLIQSNPFHSFPKDAFLEHVVIRCDPKQNLQASIL